MARTIIVNLPNENLFAFANDKISVKKEVPQDPKDIFVEGRQYVLQGVECDGLNTRPKVFELVKKIDTYNGVSFNSLIMKPINAETTMAFTLTRQDCQNLGVTFENGLLIYPKDLDWRAVEIDINDHTIDFNREYDENDMSTYPIDEKTKTVKRIILRLTGFKQISSSWIRTITNKEIPISEFLRSLLITFNKDCNPFPSSAPLSLKGTIVTSNLVPRRSLVTPLIVDNETSSIFIEIETVFKDLSNDKEYGIDPYFLVGKNIDDFIKVSWEEKNNYYPLPSLDNNRGFKDLQPLEYYSRALRTSNLYPKNIWESLF